MIYGNKDVRNKNILLNRDEKSSNCAFKFSLLNIEKTHLNHFEPLN
jgi:hypothetical protein